MVCNLDAIFVSPSPEGEYKYIATTIIHGWKKGSAQVVEPQTYLGKHCLDVYG